MKVGLLIHLGVFPILYTDSLHRGGKRTSQVCTFWLNYTVPVLRYITAAFLACDIFQMQQFYGKVVETLSLRFSCNYRQFAIIEMKHLTALLGIRYLNDSLCEKHQNLTWLKNLETSLAWLKSGLPRTHGSLFIPRLPFAYSTFRTKIKIISLGFFSSSFNFVKGNISLQSNSGARII